VCISQSLKSQISKSPIHTSQNLILIMKKYKIIAFLLPIFFFSNCDLNVIDDPVGITPEKSTQGSGPLGLLSGALKSAFEGHNQMCWVAGLVGNEELSSISANISQTPILIEQQGKLPADLGQNSSQANLAYSALALAKNAREALAKSANYSANAKTAMLANISMIEGIMYGDWAKFYEAGYELGTGNKLTPEQTRTLAIARLEDAAKNFAAIAPFGAADSLTAKGVFVDGPMGVKFCNAFIGMLLFDTGAKTQAAAYLSKGYTKADIGKEFGYKNSNALTTSGDAIYSAVLSGVQFQFNQYSPSFRTNAIPQDTFRRFPNNWTATQISLADNTNKINYFYPAAPGTAATAATIPTTSRAAYYPIITAAEVILMQADPAVTSGITAAQTTQAIADVLTSWKMPAALVTTLSADPTITLERVARYEYAGRGRRWAVGAKYAKWPLALEFSFR
jgi:hypothetical protein